MILLLILFLHSFTHRFKSLSLWLYVYNLYLDSFNTLTHQVRKKNVRTKVVRFFFFFFSNPNSSSDNEFCDDFVVSIVSKLNIFAVVVAGFQWWTEKNRLSPSSYFFSMENRRKKIMFQHNTQYQLTIHNKSFSITVLKWRRTCICTPEERKKTTFTALRRRWLMGQPHGETNEQQTSVLCMVVSSREHRVWKGWMYMWVAGVRCRILCARRQSSHTIASLFLSLFTSISLTVCV